mgnify:CR=1 FL=1
MARCLVVRAGLSLLAAATLSEATSATAPTTPREYEQSAVFHSPTSFLG